MKSRIQEINVEPVRHAVIHFSLRHDTRLLTMTFACLVFLPLAGAVTPPPDGGYPNQNTAEGDNALLSLSSGTDNTAIGFEALASNTTGNATAVGSGALQSNTTGIENVAVGYDSLYYNTTGIDNTAVGSEALGGTTADENTAVGAHALLTDSTGAFNTAVGSGAMFNNYSGSSNTVMGEEALYFGNGSENTAIGAEAMGNSNSQSTASHNTAIGVGALANTTADYNTGSGEGSLVADSTGHDNTADGLYTLRNNTTGSDNVAVGANAGANLTIGDHNIDIGADVVGLAGEAYTTRIGRQGTQKAVFIAGIAGVPVNGREVIVASNGKLGVAASSARFKEAIKPMDKASEVILDLKPVTFRYKEEIDPAGIPQFGLVAEQVETVNPDLVDRDEEGKPYTVRYEAVNAMLLNEFIKEHKRVQELEAKVAQQETDFEAAMLKQTAEMANVIAGLKGQGSEIRRVKDQLALSRGRMQVVADER